MDVEESAEKSKEEIQEVMKTRFKKGCGGKKLIWRDSLWNVTKDLSYQIEKLEIWAIFGNELNLSREDRKDRIQGKKSENSIFYLRHQL